MKKPDGATQPFWLDHVDVPQYRSFAPGNTAETDVCVIGAGIAGLTTAYLLASEGRPVIVFDEGPIGSGQTSRTSAHLASAIDDRFVEIERMHGQEGSRLAYESHATAIDTIERICKEEKIDCDFARLNAFLSRSESDPPDLLDKELAAAKRAGFADVELLATGGFNDGPCLRFGRQARFHPMKYLAGLAEAVHRKGGKVFTGRRVMDVQGTDPKNKKLAQIKLKGIRKTIHANHVVVATNTPSPINDWFGIYAKQTSYRTYMIGVAIPKGTVPNALYWDTGMPYHYVRVDHLSEKSDLLLVGGEDHKTGQMPEHGGPFMRLEEWAKKRFPMMGEVQYRWSGQVQEPADGLAFIGRAVTDKEGVYVITGDSGMGLTHGTIGGLLIADQIAGRPNAWEKLYDPSRKTFNEQFMKENANTLLQYMDLLTPAEVTTVDDVPKGYGAVIREGLSKIAVYRDPNDKVHKCSAVCTHLQCIVAWNHIENTWDCPCHGSRFDAMGKVLMGPAIDDLQKAK